MKRILRVLLIVGILAGGLAIVSPSAEAGPYGRGPFRRGGWGRAYGPGWGYRAYRPYGYGRGGYRMGFRPYGWGYRGYGWGYPANGVGYPAYGINNSALGVFGPGYAGSGFGVFPGGSPLGGFSVSSYPY